MHRLDRWFYKLVASALIPALLAVNVPAFAGSCADLADDAESQLQSAKTREEYQNVVSLAQRALAAGRGTACGAQANVIMKDAQKELRKLDEADRKAAEEQRKADEEKAKQDADKAKRASDEEKKKKKESQKIDMLDFRLAFDGGATPKDQVMAMVDGRVVPTGYSELVSSGAHELVLSPPPSDAKRAFDLEVTVDRKKLEPSSRTATEFVYAFDSKKGANITLHVTLVKLNADENKPEKKRFPWHTVTIVSGAILLVGGGTLALWNYPKYTDRDERATDWIKKYCPDETRSGLVCGEKSDQQMVNELWDARDHFGRYALTGGIIAGVGVGLIALGLFVLQPPSDDSKSAASSAGRGAVRAAPTPGLSESPILDIVPVIAPSNYGLILNGTF